MICYLKYKAWSRRSQQSESCDFLCIKATSRCKNYVSPPDRELTLPDEIELSYEFKLSLMKLRSCSSLRQIGAKCPICYINLFCITLMEGEHLFFFLSFSFICSVTMFVPALPLQLSFLSFVQRLRNYSSVKPVGEELIQKGWYSYMITSCM